MRKAGIILAVAVLAACSSSSSQSDGGTTSTTDGGSGSHRKIIEVKGTIQYHPVEVAWANKNGFTLPSLDGAQFNVEDAISAQANNPPLKSITLQPSSSPTTSDPAQLNARTWSFDVPGVDVTYTTLALVGSVLPAAGAQPGSNGDALVFSGYGLGVPPFPALDENLQVFVVSMNFVKLLAASIPDYQGAGGAAQMLTDGFVIAQATDPSGLCGSPGVQMYEVYGTGPTARTELIQQDTYYFNSDLTGLNPPDMNNQHVTSSSGLFVRVNAGSAASYTMMAPGATYLMGSQQYQTHLNGSRQGTALMVFFKQLYMDGGTGGGGLDSIGGADGGVSECGSIFGGGSEGGTADAGSADAGTAGSGQ